MLSASGFAGSDTCPVTVAVAAVPSHSSYLHFTLKGDVRRQCKEGRSAVQPAGRGMHCAQSDVSYPRLKAKHNSQHLMLSRREGKEVVGSGRARNV